jgi:tRNA(Ile)-lysidine synthase
MTEALAWLGRQVRAAVLDERFEEQAPPLHRVIVGVSGGPDSTALLRALVDVRERFAFPLSAAHVAYGLRGRDSEGDRRFVEEICREWGVELEVREVSEEERERLRRSLQDEARKLRRGWLAELASGCARVALAHHRDDQVETFFLHLLRGAGPRGLAGMAEVSRDGLFRPFLPLARAEVAAFLERRGIPFRNDRSNDQDEYLRNRIRHRLVPVLRELQPSAEHVIARTMEVLAREDAFVARAAADLLASCRAEPCGGASLELATLLGAAPAVAHRVVRELLLAWPGGEVPASLSDEVLALAGSGREGARRAWRGRGACTVSGGRLWVQEAAPPPPPLLLSPDSPSLSAWGFAFSVVRHSSVPVVPPGADSVFLSEPDVVPPLRLRTALPGDALAAHGGAGLRRVSALLGSAGVPLPLRRYWPVLEDGRGILWVAGVRRSALVPDATGPALEVRLETRRRTIR